MLKEAKKVLPKIQYGYKNAEFDADFETVENLAKKIHAKKLLLQNDRKIELFYFIT
jgi:hypothetical protein